jgi:UDP-N-acetylmuramoyl-tripeptide--D-alanyl-D-alanine ligase
MINFSNLKKIKGYLNSINTLEIKAGLCLDSRDYAVDEAFLAISGENFNAVKYLEEILKKGCPLVIYTSTLENESLIKELSLSYKDRCFVSVEDSITFFQNLMSEHLADWRKNNKAIIISGSNGKTTTKEMIYFLLDHFYPSKVIKTEKNNNNHIGVPLTIKELSEDNEFLVLELGSNHPGEMEALCKIVKPNIAYVTNVGETHLEFFDTLDNVFKEETTCFEFVKNSSDNIFFKNSNDEFLRNLSGSFTCSMGKDPKNEYMIVESTDKCELVVNKTSYLITNESLIGAHNFFNLAAAISIIHKITKISIEQLIRVSKEFKPRDNRSQWINYKNKKIFLDAYNANPSSMLLSLKGFIEKIQNDKCELSQALFILGDMNELGQHTEASHQKIARYLQDSSCNNLRFIGQYAGHYLDGLKGAFGRGFYNAASYKEEFDQNDLKSFDYVFIKGSRSLQLESLIDIK